jgi:nitrogen fixation NifU-like protein
MAYKEKVTDHFENPRNVGTLAKDEPDVGTGLVGAPACGDVMRLQVRVEERLIGVRCTTCHGETRMDGVISASFSLPCGHGEFVIMRGDVIADAKFKTFGCGSAIASSSLVTEWVKGRTTDEALRITNRDIAEELSLPPVKIHCSVLAEDAVKAAIADFRAKRAARLALAAAKEPEPPVTERVPLPAEFPATPVAEEGHARPYDPFEPGESR